MLLHDRPLTVLHIVSQRLHHGMLAFFSACHTATGGVMLPDELIHLAAALRLAGYWHVVGTLWSIGDHLARTVTEDAYAQLLRGGRLDVTDTVIALHRPSAGCATLTRSS